MSGQTPRKQRVLHRLNPKQISALGPRPKRDASSPDDYAAEYIMFDGGGLCLIVRLTKDRQSVTKAFEFRYTSRVTGKEEKIRLGSYPTVSLQAARAKAETYRREHADGTDPKAAIKLREEAHALESAKDGETFGKLATAWLDKERPHWGEGHTERVEGMFKNHILHKRFDTRPFGEQPMHRIKLEWVAKIVNQCASTSPGVAGRVRGVIREVFSHAVNMGVLQPQQNFMAIVKDVGGSHRHNGASLPAIIEPAIFRELLLDLDAYEGRSFVVGACLRLLPLLAQRPGQVANMRWEDVDLNAAKWSVRGEDRKMKSKAAKKSAPAFVVPLSTQAVAILRGLQEYMGASNGYVFLGLRKGRPISENTLNTALRAIGWRTKDTGECSEAEQKRIHCCHGFRTSFLTLTQEFFGSIVGVAADRHLGHIPKFKDAASQLGTVYDRTTLLDERTVLVQRWADALDVLKADGTVPMPTDP